MCHKHTIVTHVPILVSFLIVLKLCSQWQMTQHVMPYLITWAIKVSNCLGENTKKINHDLTWKNTVALAWTLSSLETSTLV